MLIVQLNKKTSIEKALKQLKSKVIRTKQLKKLRDRKQFVKPSIVHRTKIKKAQYVQKLRDAENL